MTIQEAIKSGLPFRLPSWDKWRYCIANFEILFVQDHEKFLMERDTRSLTVGEILSTEWELKRTDP